MFMVWFKLLVCFIYFIFFYSNVNCEICCSNRDSVLNSKANESKLIQAMYTAITGEGQNESYPFIFNRYHAKEFIKHITNNLLPVITETSKTNDEKHFELVKHIFEFLGRAYIGTNKSQIICIPINGFGYVGDYLECEVNDTKMDTKLPDYELQCSKWFPEKPYWFIDGSPCHKPYCCENITMLLNEKTPNDSVLISSFYEAFRRPLRHDYPFAFSTNTERTWTETITTEWNKTIGAQAKNIYIKHKEIYDSAIRVMTKSVVNISAVACIPLHDWGYFGDYLQCVANDLKIKPSMGLECAAQFGWTQTWLMKEKPCFRNKTAEPDDFCCSNRRYLLNVHNAAESILIKSFIKAIGEDKKEGKNPFYWSIKTGEEWKKFMTDEWEPVIKDKTISYQVQHEKIYNATIKELGRMDYNKSRVVCVTIEEWGYFGDYLQCTLNAKSVTAPTYGLKCKSWFNVKQNWMRTAVPCKKNHCCDGITELFNFGNSLGSSSKVIQAFYEGVESAAYPLKSKWSSYRKKMWRAEMDNWITAINNKATDTDKQDAITKVYKSAYDYLKDKVMPNKSYVVCTYIEGYGYFGDLMKCLFEKANANQEPKFMLTCPEYFNSPQKWVKPPKECAVPATKPPECCKVSTTFSGATLTAPENHCGKVLEYKCKATGMSKSCFVLTYANDTTEEMCSDTELSILTVCGENQNYNGLDLKAIRCVSESACCQPSDVLREGDEILKYPLDNERCLAKVKIVCAESSQTIQFQDADGTEVAVTDKTPDCKNGLIVGNDGSTVIRKAKCA